MECLKCKKVNDTDANFCIRCGIKLNKLDNCPVCLNDKECLILMCGHKCCKECLGNLEKKNNYINCPQCRKRIKQCSSCSSYRVLEEEKLEKCLDCGNEVIIKFFEKPKNSRLKCIDCNSIRILFNHNNDSYSCQDCFIKFTIDKETSSMRILNSTESITSICSLCCSNDITGIVESGEYIYYCKNCKNKDVKIKYVSLEEYSRLRIKDKEEVNKKKVIVCSECNSDKVFNMSFDEFDKKYFCNNCNKQNVKIITI